MLTVSVAVWVVLCVRTIVFKKHHRICQVINLFGERVERRHRPIDHNWNSKPELVLETVMAVQPVGANIVGGQRVPVGNTPLKRARGSGRCM